MTAVEAGEDVMLLDAGFYLPAIVDVQERDREPTAKSMRNIGALPDDTYLDKNNLLHKVRGLAISHAHLDHVGGVQYMAPRYKNAPVLGTPFTTEVLRALMEDSRSSIKNEIVPIKPNGSYMVQGKKEKFKVEFINITHSTIQSTMMAVHTKQGIVLYANDYKFDNAPVMGEKPNYKRLKELSKIGVKALVADCLYAPEDRKTPSEKIARGLLEDVLFTTDNRNGGIIITTFSSHIARLKSIAEFGKKLNREVVFFGRSLGKYTNAARQIGKLPFKNDIKIATYRHQVERMMKKINRDRKNYMIVCTGHQGEPGAILDRISRGRMGYRVGPQDHIIFSSKTIPTPTNVQNRADLDKRLKKFKPRMFDNVHVSGHGGREDLRDLIQLVNPEHFVPSHGDKTKTEAGLNLALEMGYRKNSTAHLLENGKRLKLR